MIDTGYRVNKLGLVEEYSGKDRVFESLKEKYNNGILYEVYVKVLCMG